MICICPNPLYWLPKWFTGPAALLVMTVVLCQIESGLRERYLPMQFATDQMQLAREATPINPTGNDDNNDKLVYLTGTLQSPSSITLDDPTGVVVPDGVLKLTRTVWLYHWVSVNARGNQCKARWYNPKLSLGDLDCKERWRHKNPPPAVEDTIFYASPLQLGNYTLDTPQQVLDDVTAHFANRADKNMQPLDVSEMSPGPGWTPVTPPGLKQSALYSGKDYDKPEIGDAMVSYDILWPIAVSTVARQQNNTHLDNIFVIRAGTVSLEELAQTLDDPGARSAYETFSNGIGWGRILMYLILAGCTIVTLEGYPVLQDWVPLKSLQVLVVPGILLFTISGLFLQSYQPTKGFICLGVSGILAVELLWWTCRRSFSSNTGNEPKYNDLELSQTQSQNTSLEDDDIEEDSGGDRTAVV